MTTPHYRDDDMDGAAAAWAARIGSGPLTLAERRALDGWLATDPAHGPALAEARDAWAKMGALRFAPGALALDIVAPRAPRSRPWTHAAAMAACVLLTLTGTACWFGHPLNTLRADYSTGSGELKTAALPDGSIVQLGPSSAIATHYSETTRQVELLSGQAYFTAAPMNAVEPRPFVVEAANGRARALGTRFMVNRLTDTVEVTVAEHDVEVTLGDGSGEHPSTVLSPGQSVRYGASEIEPPRPASVDLATAWLQGSLIFDHMPLADVVAELNRYRRTPIVIADEALASRTVSGVLETADTDAALATITRVLDVRTTSIPPLVTLLH